MLFFKRVCAFFLSNYYRRLAQEKKKLIVLKCKNANSFNIFYSLLEDKGACVLVLTFLQLTVVIQAV